MGRPVQTTTFSTSCAQEYPKKILNNTRRRVLVIKSPSNSQSRHSGSPSSRAIEGVSATWPRWSMGAPPKSQLLNHNKRQDWPPTYTSRYAIAHAVKVKQPSGAPRQLAVNFPARTTVGERQSRRRSGDGYVLVTGTFW